MILLGMSASKFIECTMALRTAFVVIHPLENILIAKAVAPEE